MKRHLHLSSLTSIKEVYLPYRGLSIVLDGYTGAIKCIHGFTMEALEDSEITYEVMDEGFLFADGAEGVAEAVAGIDYFYDQNPDAERWYNAHPVFKQNAPDQGSPLRATDPSFWRT